MTYLVGIDVGTTNLKAVLYDTAAGAAVQVATRPTPTQHPRPEWSQFDPDALWKQIASCIRAVARAATDPRQIAGIAVASMGEAGLPLDEAGQPLYPIMAWHDPRGEEYVSYWQRAVGEERIYDLTGIPLGSIYGLNRVLWLREHHPALYARMVRWLSVEDYVLWRLAGVYATDYTIAARTMAFSPAEQCWSAPMLAAGEVAPELLPTPYPSGSPVGDLSAEAARQTGLAVGTPVVTGGHDHLCGALTVGVIAPGTLLDSTGTSQAIVAVTPQLVRHPALARAGHTSYNHVVPGQYVVLGGLIAGGKMVEWFVDTFYDLPRARRFAAALAEAAAAPPLSGVFWLPHLLGNSLRNDDPSARAACLGLDATHTRGAILRGLIESLSYAMRQDVAALTAAGVPAVEQTVAIGGGARSDLWMQTKADVLGWPVRVPVVDEAVAIGAALLAGIGAGVFAGASEAHASLRAPKQIYNVDPAWCRAYDLAYTRVYERLYDDLRGANERIAAARRAALAGAAG